MKRNIIAGIIILGICGIVSYTTYTIDGMIKGNTIVHEAIEEKEIIDNYLETGDLELDVEEVEVQPEVSSEYLEEVEFNSQH